MKIYISSTYNDLKDYRKSVYNALLKLDGVEVVAMEKYVATDKRPVDKCLFDVSNCDVYIGIFAWRYGYIPNGQNKSITELEYQKAEQTNKTKLIFMLKDNAEWPSNYKEQSSKKINRLRTKLENNHIVSYFQTKDELSKEVLTAISNILHKVRNTNNPLQLPPKVVHFTGREDELTKLINDLQPGKVVTLCGPGGIGKSALASKAIWKLVSENIHSQRFPDGIIWHDFYTNPSTQHVLIHIAQSFGEVLEPTPEIAAKRALSGRRVLILLDGAEDADNLPFVLNVLGACCALVTTRKKKDAVEQRLDIQTLSTDEAVKLFILWSKASGDITVVKKICEIIGCLPLSVRLSGKYIFETEESIDEYLEDLEKTPLNILDQGKRKLESVTVLLKRSLGQVSDIAVQILEIAGILEFASFSKKVIRAAIPINISIKKPINELISYGLVNRIDDDRFIISHVLIYTYVKKHNRLNDGIFKFYPIIEMCVAKYYDSHIRNNREQGHKGYSTLDQDRVHIMRLMEVCKEKKMWNKLNSIVWASKEYFYECGYWEDQIIACKFGIEATQNLNDIQGEAFYRLHLGSTYLNLGKIEKAKFHFEESLILSRKIKHIQLESLALSAIGSTYRDLGLLEESISYYEQAISIRSIENIGALNGLGTAYYCLGQLDKAKDFFKKVLKEKEKNQEDISFTLVELARVYCDLGKIETSIEYYENALAICKETGNRIVEMQCLGGLGQVYGKLKNKEKAKHSFENALSIAKNFGARKMEISLLGNLGNFHSMLGEDDKSIHYYKQSITLSRKIGDRFSEGEALRCIALVYKKLEKYDDSVNSLIESINVFEKIKTYTNNIILEKIATNYIVYANVITEKGSQYATLENHNFIRIIKECKKRKLWNKTNELVCNIFKYFEICGYWEELIIILKSGVEVSQNLNDRKRECFYIGCLANIYRKLGQKDKSIYYYEKALFICTEILDKQSEVFFLGNLGHVFKDTGEIKKSLDYYEKAIAKSVEEGYLESEINWLNSAGLAYSSLGEIQRAISYYEKALILSRQSVDRIHEGNALGNLGLAYKELGQIDKAIMHHKKSLKINIELGNKQGESNQLGNLGLAYNIAGEIDKAKRYYESALSISKIIGDKKNEGLWLGNLGLAYIFLKDNKKAIIYLEKALNISRELVDKVNESCQLGNLGLAYSNLGHIEKAIKYHELSLAICREIEYKHNEANQLVGLGMQYLSLGKISRAKHFLKDAINILDKINKPKADTIRMFLQKSE